jgi:hypothetical protein
LKWASRRDDSTIFKYGPPEKEMPSIPNANAACEIHNHPVFQEIEIEPAPFECNSRKEFDAIFIVGPILIRH